MNDLLLQFAVTLPALLISLVFHEVSHGYVAYRLGDHTARRMGRLSLNPIRHLDVFGTLILFITFFSSSGQMLFGWAKPVPINPRQFKKATPQRGMMWVGAAGPAANLAIVVLSALILERIPISNELLLLAVFRVFQLNVILMIFNLVPVPPLDGSRVLGGFLPPQTYIRWAQLDQYGMMFVLLFLFLIIGPLNSVFFDIITAVYRFFLPSFNF